MMEDPIRAAARERVAELIDALDAVAGARTPHQKTLSERRVADLRTQIETHVTELFGLSAADMDIVRAVPVPT